MLQVGSSGEQLAYLCTMTCNVVVESNASLQNAVTRLISHLVFPLRYSSIMKRYSSRKCESQRRMASLCSSGLMSISQSGPNLQIFSLSFQIVKAMQRELANSGLSPEEILAKTMLLQKAMQGEGAFMKYIRRIFAPLPPSSAIPVLFVRKIGQFLDPRGTSYVNGPQALIQCIVGICNVVKLHFGG